MPAGLLKFVISRRWELFPQRAGKTLLGRLKTSADYVAKAQSIITRLSV